MSSIRRALASIPLMVSLLVFSASLAGRQAAPSAGSLTLTVKGSTTYAKATSVSLASALLVVTPVWEDHKAVTEVGGKETSGQPLFLSELAVVLSNRALDCTTVFSAPPPTGDDFTVAAGKTEAYLPVKGWQTTTVGKVFLTATDASTATLTVDQFSIDVQGAGLKKKMSKDGVKGNNGKLVLMQTAGTWKADFALKSDDVTAEGQVPLTACPVTSRKKSAGMPILGENRLISVARAF